MYSTTRASFFFPLALAIVALSLAGCSSKEPGDDLENPVEVQAPTPTVNDESSNPTNPVKIPDAGMVNAEVAGADPILFDIGY